MSRLCFSKKTHFYVKISKKFYGQKIIIKKKILEGILERNVFVNILKWLPIGMTDDDIEKIMNNDIKFNDSGRVNYLSIVNDSVFKRMKLVYQLRKNLID